MALPPPPTPLRAVRDSDAHVEGPQHNPGAEPARPGGCGPGEARLPAPKRLPPGESPGRLCPVFRYFKGSQKIWVFVGMRTLQNGVGGKMCLAHKRRGHSQLGVS